MSGPEPVAEKTGVIKKFKPRASSKSEPRDKFNGVCDLPGILLTNNGTPKANIANALTVFRSNMKGVVAFDEFSNRTVMLLAPPWHEGNFEPRTEWSSYHDVRAAEWLQHQGIGVSPEIAGQAIDTVARDITVHPVREYLDGLVWDAVPRLDDWTVKYLGAGSNGDEGTLEFVKAAGSRWLISAVARIFRPGVKADHCPIFEGEQGIKKSTMLRTLFHPWFSDDLADLGTKDSAMQLGGVWCIEIAELDSMSRSEKERIKSYMSRAVDRYRPPYGRRVIECPRQSVFAGTVNGSEYLRDETGARRFWPIACTAINVDGLASVRDQLWAEAASRYQAGEPWWLETPSLVNVAKSEQSARYSVDPWHDKISDYVAMRQSVTVDEVLRDAIVIEQARWTKGEQMRVGATLTALGWRRRQLRNGGKGKRIWHYFSPSPLSPLSESEVVT